MFCSFPLWINRKILHSTDWSDQIKDWPQSSLHQWSILHLMFIPPSTLPLIPTPPKRYKMVHSGCQLWTGKRNHLVKVLFQGDKIQVIRIIVSWGSFTHSLKTWTYLGVCLTSPFFIMFITHWIPFVCNIRMQHDRWHHSCALWFPNSNFAPIHWLRSSATRKLFSCWYFKLVEAVLFHHNLCNIILENLSCIFNDHPLTME